MSAHKKVNKLLADFVLGELPERQASEVKSHLVECRECRSELKRLEALVECTMRISKLSADEQMCSSAKNRIFTVITGEEESKTIAWPNIGQPFRWRIIMKSPITKLAVAAVVIIACLIGLSLWRTTSSGIALADVLAQIEKTSAYRHECNSTLTDLMQPNVPAKSHYTMLRSRKYGYKTVPDDPNDEVNYYSIPDKVGFIIRPKQKEYERIYFPGEKMTSLAQNQYSYYSDRIVKKILGCKYESMGRSIIDGVEVEGFRTTDPNYASQKKPSQVDVRIWVDVKTRLLVRSEEHITKDKEIWDFITHDYRWDIPVDAADFKPVIPDDYTRTEKDLFYTYAKLKDITEENVIQGLKLYADLSGHYPKNATWLPEVQYQWSVFEKSETPAALRLKEELKGLTEDDKANRLRDALMPMHCINGFYYWLKKQNKDCAYYGETVTPKVADKILMRWKVSDNEYRIIFGDLHTETVTSAKLAELEAALPK
jgi:hypothetical protein